MTVKDVLFGTQALLPAVIAVISPQIQAVRMINIAGLVVFMMDIIVQ